MELKVPKSLAKSQTGKGAAKKSKTAKSRGARFVVFLGDEGAILVYLKGNSVQSRQFISDSSEQNLGEFRQTLAKDTHAPVLMVVDSMDQSFMQQSLPPVSSFSVGKLIRRRLERDFAGNDVKGAILLGREKTGRKDWNFLMVALEKSPQFTVWLNFIQQLPNRFLGIYLASVESEFLVERLEHALGVEKSKGEGEWKFFVSHNKVGGFRQVIMKNGRIIFTRLAQPIGESNVEVVAGSIEQEMLSTIEYMKRLSFSPQNKLDIYIITSSGIKAVLDASKFNANSFHVLTPYEVAQYLRIEGAAQPTDQFGDVVMATVIGSSKKHVLRLSAPQTKRVDQYYQLITSQRTAATLAVCAILGYGGYLGYNIFSLIGETEELTMKRDTMQKSLDALRLSIKDSNLDVEKASDFIDLYQLLNDQKLAPFPFLRRFEPLAKAPVWITNMEWVLEAPASSPVATPPTPGGVPPVKVNNEPQMLAKITLEFPKEASEPRMFKVLAKKILNDYKEHFQGYDISYNNLPGENAQTDKLEIRSGITQESTVSSLEVKMTIRGNQSLLSAPPVEIKTAPVAPLPAVTNPVAGATP